MMRGLMRGLWTALAAGVVWTGAATAQNLADMPPKPMNLGAPKDVRLEPVGIASVSPWVMPVATFRVEGTDQWRAIIARKESRAAKAATFLVLHLNTGTLKTLAEAPAYETRVQVWAGGKFYIGMNLPSLLYVYDPAADTLTNLGQAFEKGAGIMRLAVAADGTIAAGVGAGSTEVSLYDPKTAAWVKYGSVGSAGNGYVYELAQDNGFIYAATRGKDPWQLVVINKKSREMRVALTAPPDGYINVGPGLASVRQADGKEWVKYDLRDGQVTPHDPKAQPAPTPQPPAVKPPQVDFDPTPLYEGGKEMDIVYQDPANRAEWKTVKLPVTLASEPLVAATALPDGRIAALSGAYNPMVVFDPKTNEGKQAPMPSLSGRAILAVDGIIYATGYPGSLIMRYDPDKPLTSPTALKNFVAVPEESPKANPRLVARFPMTATTGGHIGTGLWKGPDGRIFLCTRRHRHHSGFDIAWYDPKTDQSGTVEDGGRLNHLQVGWVAPLDGGKKLIISTYVQPNSQVPGQPPDSAKLLVLDLAAQKYEAKYVPLPGFKVLTGVVEVAPNKVVGLAPEKSAEADKFPTTTYVYRFDLAAGKLEQVVRYTGVIQGMVGNSGLPQKGHDFTLGPDGRIWTGVEVGAELSAILRINPADLTLQSPGRVHNNVVLYLFHDGNLYLTGAAKLRRAVDYPSWVAPAPRQ